MICSLWNLHRLSQLKTEYDRYFKDKISTKAPEAVTAALKAIEDTVVTVKVSLHSIRNVMESPSANPMFLFEQNSTQFVTASRSLSIESLSWAQVKEFGQLHCRITDDLTRFFRAQLQIHLQDGNREMTDSLIGLRAAPYAAEMRNEDSPQASKERLLQIIRGSSPRSNSSLNTQVPTFIP